MNDVEATLDKLVELLAELPQVDAIALGGSRAGSHADAASDFDLSVCTNDLIAPATRRGIVEQLGGASVDRLDHIYFGGGDEWIDARTGRHFDAMYFALEWWREQVERPLKHHQPSLGYTTAFAYTVNRSRILHDPQGELARLQEATRVPYPEPLREAVVHHNRLLLRGTLSSYFEQLEKAVTRDDLVSVTHRVAALMASYFDILFAVNRALHPGEKQLVRLAGELPSLPERFEQDVTATLTAAMSDVLPALTRQLDALDAWLAAEDLAVGSVRSAGHEER